MTMQLATPDMSAHSPTDYESTARTSGEEVKAMVFLESRPEPVVRAWDEMSEIDRAVLLESVRQRRKAQAHKQRIHSEVYALRINR